MGLLSAKITINRVEKFATLSSAKLISLLIHQTLIPPNFRRLWYYFLPHFPVTTILFVRAIFLLSLLCCDLLLLKCSHKVSFNIEEFIAQPTK